MLRSIASRAGLELPSSPAELRSRGAAAPESGRGRSGIRRAAEPREVELSTDGRAAQQTRTLERALLRAFEERLPEAQRALFEQAGREDYLASIAEETDRSPGATTQRIVGGITGYIYRAFQRANPDPTPADVDRFEREVLAGFERGLRESEAVLESLSRLSPELAGGIEQVAQQVREQVESFASAERERLSA